MELQPDAGTDHCRTQGRDTLPRVESRQNNRVQKQRVRSTHRGRVRIAVVGPQVSGWLVVMTGTLNVWMSGVQSERGADCYGVVSICAMANSRST